MACGCGPIETIAQPRLPLSGTQHQGGRLTSMAQQCDWHDVSYLFLFFLTHTLSLFSLFLCVYMTYAALLNLPHTVRFEHALNTIKGKKNKRKKKGRL